MEEGGGTGLQGRKALEEEEAERRRKAEKWEEEKEGISRKEEG